MHERPPMTLPRLLAGALSLAALIAPAALTGCVEDREGVPGDTAAEAATHGEAMGAALAAQAEHEPMPAALAHLGAILLALDRGELAQSAIALDRVDDPIVFDYAALMSTRHAAHAAEMEALLADRGISPLTGSLSSMLRAEARADEDELKLTPRRELAFTYMRLQVKVHAAGDVLLSRLSAIAPDDEPLRALLASTRDAVVAHRLQAEAILRAR